MSVWRDRRLPTGVVFVLSRLAQSLFVLLGALLICFVLINVSGSSVVVQGGGFLTPEQVRDLEQQLGYDRPIPERLAEYLGNVVTGDFGESYRFGGPAVDVAMEALPNTLILVALALALSLILGLAGAVYSVLHQDARSELVMRGSLSVIQGVPEFWLALMLVLLFAVNLRFLPSIGFDGPSSLVLPVVALAVPITPAVFRLLRGQLLDVLGQDFVVALRAKGLTDRAIVFRHALRNAMPSFVNYLALQAGSLIGGTLLVEVVFQWPGIGSLVLSAVDARDLVVVQVVVIIVAVGYIVLNLLADLVVLWLDPRVRLGRL